MTVRPAAQAAAAVLLAAAVASPPSPARAQAPAASPPAAPISPAPPQAQPDDPVVARVDGEPLRLSDVVDTAADLLPPELRTVAPGMLLGMLPPDMVRQLTERAITERALLAAARREGLDREPDVRRRMRRAEEQELQQALLGREVNQVVTAEAVRARWEREAAERRGEEEVHARHILVPTETEARQALAEATRAGADFAEVARRRSSGPGAREGGDLGFFKRADMIPEFSEAAFALQAGQVSPAPVRTPFGWHVIKVEERRAVAVPPFEEVERTLRQRMMEEEVQRVVERVRTAARVERLDGAGAAPRGLLDGAAPPPAPAQGGGRTPLPAPPAPPPQRR